MPSLPVEYYRDALLALGFLMACLGAFLMAHEVYQEQRYYGGGVFHFGYGLLIFLIGLGVILFV